MTGTSVLITEEISERLAACARRGGELLTQGPQQIAEAWEAAEEGWALFRATEGVTLPVELARVRAYIQVWRGDGSGLLETVSAAGRQGPGVGGQGSGVAEPNTDLEALRGVAHTALAWSAFGPSERRAELELAARAYRAALDPLPLEQAGERYIQGDARILALNGLGTVGLLSGDPESALRCFRATLKVDPVNLGAQVGVAEGLVALRRGLEAIPILTPLLGQTDDAWIVGAAVAESLGQFGDFFVLVARCRSLVRSRLSGRRSAQYDALHSRMRAYLGRPSAGPGAAGAAGALMAGEPPARPPEPLDSGERQELATLVCGLFQLERWNLVKRLLEPRAESALPGVGEIVRAVGAQVGKSVPGGGSRRAVRRPPRPASYSILLPTIRKRDGLLEAVLANIHEVFAGHDYEIWVGDVSGKGRPAFLRQGRRVRYLSIEKPEEAVYVPFRELLEAASKEMVVVWADDLFFSRGFAARMDQEVDSGKQVIQAALVDPELHLILTEHLLAYTPAVISRVLALTHIGHLTADFGGDIPFVEACVKAANTRYEFVDQAYVLHMGYPVGQGAQSTLVDYRAPENGRWLDQQLGAWRSDHGFRKISSEEFPHAERVLDLQ